MVLRFVIVLLAVRSIALAGDFEVKSAALPGVITCESVIEVDLRLENTSDEIWDSADKYFVSYHWFDSAGEIVVWDGARSSFLEVVAPGAATSLRARLETPTAAGNYGLQWDIVHEGVRWFSQGSQVPLPMINVRLDRRWDVTLIPEHVPSRLWVGARADIVVEVENDGIDWPEEGDFSLSAHWFDSKGELVQWEGERTPLPALAGGEATRLTANIRGPDQAGVYVVRFDLVLEGVLWFSEYDENIAAPWVVVVLPGPYFPWFSFILVVLLVVGLLWRRLGWRWLVWADLIWLGGSLFAKQWILFDQTALAPGRHYAALSLAGVGVLVALVAIVPRRIRPWLSVTVGFFASVLIFGDIVYQRFFGDLLSLAVWHAFGQTAQVSESAFSLVQFSDMWLFVDVLFALILAWLVPQTERSLRSAALVVMVVAGAILASLGTQFFASSQVFRNVFVASEVGLLNFHAFDVMRGFGGKLADLGLDEGRLNDVKEFFRVRGGSRCGSGQYFGAARSMNLVMIQVESLQAFVPLMRVQGQEVTPTLNRWMNEGFAFTNVFDQTEQGRSSDCELLTQTSLLPLSSGAAVFVYGDNEFTGLASVLRAEGYHTVSAVPFAPSFWNRRITHRAFGYQENLFEADFGPGESIGWGLNDHDFLSQMATKLGDLEEPFCAWMITLSLHHPFTGFPPAHRVLDVGRWQGTPFGNYLHTMKFFDDALANFEAELRASGLLSNTVIVIWGDHDAGFEWTGDIAQAIGASEDDLGWYLSQRVPLIIRIPGVEGDTREVVAGQVDVAPTLLALIGVDPKPYAFVGRNLLGEANNHVVTGEYRCWIDQTHIYLNRGPKVESGDCLVRQGFKKVPAAQCQQGFDEAAKMLEMSETVLEFDLQKRLATQD